MNRWTFEPSMMGLALNTLNGYRGSGEGHWLDNADADTLRDMVRIAVKELAEILDAAPDAGIHYWQNRCLDHATGIDQERVLRVTAEARVAELEAALGRALGMMTTPRIGQIGGQRIYSPQIDVRHVEELRVVAKGKGLNDG